MLEVKATIEAIKLECQTVNINDINSIEHFIEMVDDALVDLCMIVDKQTAKKR